MNAIDLFCGAGGASLGIENAGFDLVAAIDADEQALQTHNENLTTPIVKHDLSDVDPSVLPTQEVGYVHGSPPCKGFSTANDQRDESDPRNALVFDFVDWVKKLQPRVVSMENVTGMLSITTEFMDHVEAAYRDAGYKVKYQTLNAADYGVPQTRERVYTIGVREDIETPSRWFPKPTHTLGGSRTLEGEWLPPWNGLDTVIDTDGQHKSQGRTSPAAWRDPSQPSHTVTGSGNNVVRENGECRAFSIDEFKRIQTFPEWYEFNCGKSDAYLQTGNAVPPKLQEAVATHLRGIA